MKDKFKDTKGLDNAYQTLNKEFEKRRERVKELEMKDKLKPCPFCGRRAYVGKTDDGLWFYVYCCNEDCAISPKTKMFNRKEYVIREWNRRVENER
jgi:ribosomal protein L37AE/L43A